METLQSCLKLCNFSQAEEGQYGNAFKDCRFSQIAYLPLKLYQKGGLCVRPGPGISLLMQSRAITVAILSLTITITRQPSAYLVSLRNQR